MPKSHVESERNSVNSPFEKCSCASKYSKDACSSCNCNKKCRSECPCSNDCASVTSKASSKCNAQKKFEDVATRGHQDEEGIGDSCSARCFSPVPTVIGSETSVSSICSLPPSKPDPTLGMNTIRNILSKHIQNRSKELKNACKNYDLKNIGTMTKSHLSEVLNMFCMPLTKTQTTHLLRDLPMDEQGKVNYVDFFAKLCNSNFECSLKPQASAKMYSRIEDLEVMIRNQLLPDLQCVVRSFQMFDKNGDGFVKKAEFKSILHNYCFEIHKDDFMKFWDRYKTPHNELLNYSEFLIRLGVNTERIENQLPQVFHRSNLFWEKPCTKIYPSNDPGYANARLNAVIGKRNDPSIQGMTTEDIQEHFLLKLRKCRQLLAKVLPIFDLEAKGHVAMKDLCSILNTFIMPMSDGLCKELVSRLKLDTTPISKTINYKEFLDHFCKPMASEPSSEDLGLVTDCSGFETSDLRGEKLFKKLKYTLNRNKKSFEHALMACDPDSCGLIHPDQLKNILITFCFPFTKSQLEEIVDMFEIHGNRIDYTRFLEKFKKTGEGGDARNWIRIVGKILDQPRPEMEGGPDNNIEDMLRDAIRSKGKKMLKDFQTADPCHLGYSYKEDVKAIFDKYVMRTTEEQFDNLWETLPKDKKGCLFYNQLMGVENEEDGLWETRSRCKSPLENASSKARDSPEKDVCEIRSGRPFRTGNKQRDAAFNEFPHLETVYRKIGNKLRKQLGMIKQHFHRHDRKQEGKVRFHQLANILTEYKIHLIEEDNFYIQEYFDKDLSDYINYRQFLHIFTADSPKRD